MTVLRAQHVSSFLHTSGQFVFQSAVAADFFFLFLKIKFSLVLVTAT